MEDNSSPIFSIHIWDAFEASSVHTPRLDFTVKEETFCVQQVNICIFIFSGILNEGGGIGAILGILTLQDYFFCKAAPGTHLRI